MENLLKLENMGSESLLKQAEQIWTMLDDMVDNDVNSYRKFIEKTLQEGKEVMKISNPTPRFCIKAKIQSSDVNLFVNILEWAKIPSPGSNDQPIPIFGRKIEQDQNKSNLVANVALNPSVFTNTQLKTTIINLSFDYIEQQNDIKIDRNDFSIWKESNYRGDLDQIINNLTKTNEKRPEINDTDLPDNLVKKLASLGTINNTNEGPKKPLVQELTPTTNNEPITPVYEDKITTSGPNSFFNLKIYLPLVESLDECQLNVDSARNNLVLDSGVYRQLLVSFSHLEESFNVDSRAIQAKFIKKEKILKIKIPLKPK